MNGIICSFNKWKEILRASGNHVVGLAIENKIQLSSFRSSCFQVSIFQMILPICRTSPIPLLRTFPLFSHKCTLLIEFSKITSRYIQIFIQQKQAVMQDSSTINNSLSIYENQLSSVYAYPFTDSINLDASLSYRTQNKSTYRILTNRFENNTDKQQNMALSLLQLQNMLYQLQRQTLEYQKLHVECENYRHSYYEFRERVISEIQNAEKNQKKLEEEDNQVDEISYRTQKSLRAAEMYLEGKI